jgi:hypothetical protein
MVVLIISPNAAFDVVFAACFTLERRESAPFNVTFHVASRAVEQQCPHLSASKSAPKE